MYTVQLVGMLIYMRNEITNGYVANFLQMLLVAKGEILHSFLFLFPSQRKCLDIFVEMKKSRKKRRIIYMKLGRVNRIQTTCKTWQGMTKSRSSRVSV